MALVSATYSNLILTNTGFSGSHAPLLANGIAVGFTSYLTAHPLNIVSTLGDVGAPGAGTGNGFLMAATCVPTNLNGLLESSIKGAGLMGPSMSQFSLGLSIATCTYLAQAQTLTAHAGVGVGTGTGSIVGIEAAGMSAAIIAATGFSGPMWPQMSMAISSALVLFLLTNVKFIVTITGPAGSGAASGTGSGRLF